MEGAPTTAVLIRLAMAALPAAITDGLSWPDKLKFASKAIAAHDNIAYL